jgi:hypothetical protein
MFDRLGIEALAEFSLIALEPKSGRQDRWLRLKTVERTF